MNNQIFEAYLNKSNKIDSSNYTNWKLKLQTLLEGQNVYGIATDDEVKMTTTVGGSNIVIQDWEKMEMKANFLLKLSIKYCIIPHIRECRIVNDIWMILKKMYEIKNTSRILYLRKKILSIKMEENKYISSFKSQIKEVKDKLTYISQTMTNDNLVTITMNGMMDDYQMFLIGLNSRENPLAFEELIGILLQEEERRLSLKPQNPDLALMTKFKPNWKAMVDHRKGRVS